MFCNYEYCFENKIINRGHKYQKQGRVSDLAVTDNGDLIAWVSGTQRYAATVKITDRDCLNSYCTCPYSINCKHGVAVVLEYLAYRKKNKTIPVCSDGDERMYLLSGDFPDTDIDIKDDKKNMLGLLETRSKAELIDIIMALSRQYPKIAHDMATQHLIRTKDVHGLEKSIRSDIQKITQELNWGDPRKENEFIPELSMVRGKFEALLKAGYPDKVLILAEELSLESNEIIERYDNEGETGMELEACMSVAFLALKASKMDAVEKMIWALDRILEDEYGICNPIEAYFFEDHNKALWNQTVDQIMNRLGMNGKDRQTKKYAWYPRSLLIKWGVYALEQTGRTNEIIQLYRYDAKKSGNIRKFVEELIQIEQYDEAEKTLRSEIQSKKDKKSWEAIELHLDLLELMIIKKDWLTATAIAVENFICRPSEKKFIKCRDLSEKEGHWKKIKQYLLLYLETGAFPWQHRDWPLPLSGLSLPDPDNRKPFPKLEDLINIAIAEKQPEQIIKWYDKLIGQRRQIFRVNHDQIATAIKEYDPLRAVSLWKKIAENHIALVKPKAYREAAKLLKKAAKVMEAQNKKAEWLSYLNQLKKTHKRKTRLMEVIDRLEKTQSLKKI